MKHVVILKSNAKRQGGLEKHTLRIQEAFRSKGAVVSLLTTGISNDANTYAINAIGWPGFIKMEQFDRFVSKWLKNHTANIVLGMDRNKEQTHIRAGNGVHIEYLKSRKYTDGKFKHALCFINPQHRKILELEKAGFENPKLQKIITNSHLVRSQILNHYKVDPKKIEVIHNGVEWHEMHDDFQNWEQKKVIFLRKLSLDQNVLHLLFIGHGYVRKGLKHLLHALSKIKHEEFHLSVVGKDKEIVKFQILADFLGLSKKVTFFGQIQDIRPFYQMADVLLIPSFYDPFANVTVEALSMGLHVVTSKLNGGHEIITEENGTIIDDLLKIDSIVASILSCLKKRKTTQSSIAIRNSVQYLDFSNQLKKLIHACE